MVKFSIRKVLQIKEPFGGIAKHLTECTKNKKWTSTWLIKHPDKHSLFTIGRCYWKSSVKLILVEDKKPLKVDYR